MTRFQGASAVLATVLALATSLAHAQRGVGQMSGVARQLNQPEIVTLSGIVTEVHSGPCEKTTGRSPIGAHFLLKTRKGQTLNVHLGPTNQVESIAKDLEIGKRIQVQAFRTEQMEADHYVAQSLVDGDRTVQLRDENLRPFWAGGGRGQPRGRGGPRL
jgi:hypothetical protein